MNRDDHSANEAQCGDDVAAYALGALDESEVEGFRRHLETCSVCRDELAAFENVVDVLPLSAPSHRAPSSLRRRVMREVRPRRRRWQPAPVPAFAAALAAAAIAFIVLQTGSPAPTRVLHARVTGTGNAELKIRSGEAHLVVHHFSPPPAGEIYEVWLKHGAAAPSPTTALFSVNAAGDGDVEVPGSLRHVSLVMVTPEPAGGSKVPTHPPVIQVGLA